MDLSFHSERLISPSVEVNSDSDFRPSILERRISALQRAQTVKELVAASKQVTRDLSALGNATVTLDVDQTREFDASPSRPLPVVARIQLAANPTVKPLQISFASGSLYDVSGLQSACSALANNKPAPNQALLRGLPNMSAVGASVGLGLYNHFGIGESIAVLLQRQEGSVSLNAGSACARAPLTFGAGSFGVLGYYNEQQKPWASHTLASHGISADFQIPLSKLATFTLAAEATDRMAEVTSDSASAAIWEAAQVENTKTALVASLRHQHGSPTSKCSHQASLEAELAGGPGDAEYIKLGTSFQAHVPARCTGILQHLRVGGSLAAGTIIGDAPLHDRFVLGGPSDVHGTAPGSLGPHEESSGAKAAGVDGDFVGGSVFWKLRAALSVPIGQPNSALRAVALLSAATLCEGAPSARTANATSPTGAAKSLFANAQQLYKSGIGAASAATGLCYASGAGTVELLYVVPFNGFAAQSPCFNFGVSVAY